ncbi:hypothetical protein ACIBG0_19080 [Nocardia sp. NPDC050630]|uniref:hypothetical protein n=1 Tax=Nocardia sp. NPDC050630 TaxID=3364321 RepID=UPI00378DB73A
MRRLGSLGQVRGRGGGGQTAAPGLGSGSMSFACIGLPQWVQRKSTLLCADNPFQPVIVRGRVIEWLEGDAAWPIIDELATKYIGQPYSRDEERVVAVIETRASDGRRLVSSSVRHR